MLLGVPSPRRARLGIGIPSYITRATRCLPIPSECEKCRLAGSQEKNERDAEGGEPVAGAEVVGIAGEAEEFEEGAGGAAVAAVGEGGEEGSEEAEDGDGDAGPAGDAEEVGVEGFEGVEVDGPGEGDAEEDEGEEEEGEFGEGLVEGFGGGPLPGETADEELLQGAVGADVVAVELLAGEDGAE